MTLDDLELYKFEFSENFSWFRRFRTQQQLNEWSVVSIVSDNIVSTPNWSNFLACFRVARVVRDSWAFLFEMCRKIEHISDKQYVSSESVSERQSSGSYAGGKDYGTDVF